MPGGGSIGVFGAKAGAVGERTVGIIPVGVEEGVDSEVVESVGGGVICEGVEEGRGGVVFSASEDSITPTKGKGIVDPSEAS